MPRSRTFWDGWHHWTRRGRTANSPTVQDAIGTNDIQTYFPFIIAKNELYPTTFILNQLQRDASGQDQARLGFAGRHVIPRGDGYERAGQCAGRHWHQPYHPLPPMSAGALSQAVEVLRKRVDAFGVAEPVIQPAGGNRILIQLPGLSQSAKESAKQQIQKAAYLEFRMVKADSDQILKNGEPVPPGYQLLKYVQQQAGSPSRN